MSAYNGPIVDVDVHNVVKVESEVIEYLPPEWQAYAQGPAFRLRPGFNDGVVKTGGRPREDTYPPDGSNPGSDYETMRMQLLDAHPGSYRAVLTHDLGEYGGHPNQYYSRALCSAMNDWQIDTWLSKDERLYSVLPVPLAEPEEAAKEIRRVGGHPQMVSVLMSGNTLGRPLGDPLYHPIYEAAVELGLSISVHTSAVAQPMGTAVAGGRLSMFQHFTQIRQQPMHYISSLIVHGVFEKYPSLTFLMKEYGIGWLPFVMWRLDQNYELLKFESPWVKRWPSEYVHDHVKLSTQPWQESPDDTRALPELLDCVDGVEDMLCFSSDYPHITMDEADYIARRLPKAWHRKVFYENACKTYQWPVPVDEPITAAVAG